MSGQNVLDLIAGLKAVKALLMRGWTQYTDARDKHGTGVPAWSSRACSWCLTAAIYKVTFTSHPPQDPHHRVLSLAIGEAIKRRGYYSGIERDSPLRSNLVWLNDLPGMTQCKVLEILDSTVRYVRKNGVPE